MKIKTSRQLMTKLIKEMSDIDVALVREKLLVMSKEVLEKEEEIKKQMEGSIISPRLYLDTMKRVKETLDYSSHA
jgi:hypothetical protein